MKRRNFQVEGTLFLPGKAAAWVFDKRARPPNKLRQQEILASTGGRFELLLSQRWESKRIFTCRLGVLLRSGHAAASWEDLAESLGRRTSVSATSIERDLNNTAPGLYVGHLPCNPVPNFRKFRSHEHGRLFFADAESDFSRDAFNYLDSY